MNQTPPEHVHFIGIGGYGMSAIANVLLDQGYRVTGSDVVQKELTDKLAAKGAQVFIGHEAKNVQGADMVVYSSACGEDNVERIAAKQLNIPIIHRSQMLAKLMNEKEGIAVAGAHGKTTTSSMIALVMEQNGLDPTYIIGGEIMNIGNNAKAGKGPHVVAEADESDGSFLQYHPSIALVTNIEADHLENYDGDFNNLLKAYSRFLNQVTPGGVSIICADDSYLRDMAQQLKSRLITYGIKEKAEFRATDIELGDRKVSFTVLHNENKLGTMALSVPGKHNVYNALATLIICLQAGLSFDQVAQAIKQFRGAKRRFQVMGEVGGRMIIDDYAHHPTEIEATISAAKATGKKITAVFQPQRYSRTFFLLDQFSRCFSEADEVIITDIYAPAGEEKINGVDSGKLAEMIRVNSNSNVKYIPLKEDVQHYLEQHSEPGDLILTMGAGDIWKVAEGLVKQFESKLT